MQNEKITKTLNSALSHIENAVKLQDHCNDKLVEQLTWKASSDLEYALFLFSLDYPEEKLKTSKKINPRQLDLKKTLVFTRNILKEGLTDFSADHLDEFYKKTWIVKEQMLRIHNFFEKKRKKK